MTVGGDPDELHRVAAGGPGQAFTLDHTARLVEHAGDRHTVRNRHSSVDPQAAVRSLRRIARQITRLDHWVLLVAAALRVADASPVHTRLLQFGAGHPVTDALAGAGAVPVALPVKRLADHELHEIAGWSGLPGAWRDRVHRERLRRWVERTEERVAAVPADGTSGVLDRLARWVDERLVDRLSWLVDLHVTREEAVARLRAQAAGARWLLAQPDLSVWSFDPSTATPTGGPAIRVAYGDPSMAAHLAVVLPGTASGLHAPAPSLAQATAVHQHAQHLVDDGQAVATVLDLYDAPVDLGRAADPRHAATSGAATAAFLDDLKTMVDADQRTTLVGHSYGALTAARASDHHAVDALVLLGAPGAGVPHRAELRGADEVWAAQTHDDPIAAVADLDEWIRELPPRVRPVSGPLADPLVGHGPDPSDPEFGADALPTLPTHDDDRRVGNRGHLDYLAPGTVALDSVVRVLLGRLRTPSRPVRRETPPTRDRRGSAADE